MNIEILKRKITQTAVFGTGLVLLFISVFDSLGAQPSIKVIVKITNPEVASFIDLLSLTKRLKLDSFYEDGLGCGKYVFSYNYSELPIKTSYAVDYWGYYNGQKANATLIPNYSQLTT